MGCRPSGNCAESGKQLKAKGERWWGQTHLHGPHQSVCWLRPKRARHFLGEPGSAHSHARGAEQGRGRAGSGAEQGPERRVTSVLASYRHPTAPIGRVGLSMAQPAPVGAQEPRAKISGKVGTQLRSRGSGKNGREGVLSVWLISVAYGVLAAWRLQRSPRKPWRSSLFCPRATHLLPNPLPILSSFSSFLTYIPSRNNAEGYTLCLFTCGWKEGPILYLGKRARNSALLCPSPSLQLPCMGTAHLRRSGM